MSEQPCAATVYGYSDDLIEIEGALSEEIPYQDVPAYLSFPDGTVLRVDYDRHGVWRMAVHRVGLMRCEIEKAPENDEDQYSDMATLIATDPAHLASCRYSTTRPEDEVTA